MATRDEPLVVEAELTEHGRVQVAHVDGVAGDVVREVVGFAQDGAGLESAARQPHREAPGMVVSTVVLI